MDPNRVRSLTVTCQVRCVKDGAPGLNTDGWADGRADACTVRSLGERHEGGGEIMPWFKSFELNIKEELPRRINMDISRHQ